MAHDYVEALLSRLSQDLEAGPAPKTGPPASDLPGQRSHSQKDFDRFLRDSDVPLSLDGDCLCGGVGKLHRQGCPLKDKAP